MYNTIMNHYVGRYKKTDTTEEQQYFSACTLI